MLTLYGIPNCDTVKKARAWLSAENIAYDFHDFKKMGIDTLILKRWADLRGIDALMNKRGNTWRQLTPIQQASITNEETAIALLQEYPSLIKRPILEVNTDIQIGFDQTLYQQILTP